MKRALLPSLFLAVTAALSLNHAKETSSAPPPLKALMVTGGCCHDYEQQKLILSAGISERTHIDWTIVHEGGTSRDHKVSLYKKADWAKGYDVVVHNECFGALKDDAFVNGIAKAHADGVACVAIHCSMHSYRAAKTDEWRKCLGVSSYNHQSHAPIKVRTVKKDHPIMKGLPDAWTTPKGELYRIKKVWDTATPLAVGEGATKGEEHACVWVNEYGKGRTFGTTLGHHNETMLAEPYLDLVTRGLLWATGKLNDDGKPLAGYGSPDATTTVALEKAKDADGWVSLFDGTSLDHWQRGNGDPVDGGWIITDKKELYRSKRTGDIFSKEIYGDFELEFEFKIAEGSNSGLKYRFGNYGGQRIGAEYQVLDDTKHPDGKRGADRLTAALYDVIPTYAQKVTKPVGQYNQGRVVARGSRLQHFLNGQLTVDVDQNTDSWRDALEDSKFRKAKDFATKPGRIMLQDHNDPVWFRNIRIRRL